MLRTGKLGQVDFGITGMVAPRHLPMFSAQDPVALKLRFRLFQPVNDLVDSSSSNQTTLSSGLRVHFLLMAMFLPVDEDFGFCLAVALGSWYSLPMVKCWGDGRRFLQCPGAKMTQPEAIPGCAMMRWKVRIGSSGQVEGPFPGPNQRIKSRRSNDRVGAVSGIGRPPLTGMIVRCFLATGKGADAP